MLRLKALLTNMPKQVLSPSGFETPLESHDEMAWLDHFTYPTPSGSGNLNDEGPGTLGYGTFSNGTTT